MPRLALLLLAATALGACADGPAPAPEVLPTSASFAVVLDSLRIDEPARTFRVDVAVPQVQRRAGTDRAPALQAANAALRDTVRALADDLRPEPAPRFADPTPVVVSGSPSHLHLTDTLVSGLVEVSVAVADAPETLVFLPVTLDLQTGAPVAPANWFTPGTPWADTLAAHVGRDVRAQLRGRAPFSPADLADLRAGRLALTLGADAVTVHVPPYQLSPDPAAFHVAVPRAALAAFARAGGVLDPPAADQGAGESPDRTVEAD